MTMKYLSAGWVHITLIGPVKGIQIMFAGLPSRIRLGHVVQTFLSAWLPPMIRKLIKRSHSLLWKIYSEITLLARESLQSKSTANANFNLTIVAVMQATPMSSVAYWIYASVTSAFSRVEKKLPWWGQWRSPVTLVCSTISWLQLSANSKQTRCLKMR